MTPLILIALIFTAATSCGQTTTTFKLKEIGWTIKLPSDFTLVDSLTDAENTKEGSKLLEDAGGIKPDASKAKNFITAAKGQVANFNVTISKSTEPNFHYWDSINNNVIKIFYKAMVSQAPTAKFDTLRTIDTIDGVSFKNFQMHIKVNENITVHNFYITRLYEGYTIAINYYYIDEATGDEIKRMLKESKFERTLIRPNN
jgi:hypothetical protein